ncbi:MAG: ACP phosphodiesterase [Candidatus Neomarinimicrobiota bacterium]
MNYLAHLYLSSHSDAALVGALLGDFVKLDHYRCYPAPVAQAIILHRRIDSFTDAHSLHRASRRRLDGRFRHTRGLLVDLFYDHFLARDWNRWASQPLEAFAQRAYAAMEAVDHPLPPRLERMLPYMVADNWLASYRDLENIGRALAGLSRRLQVPNHLEEGLPELTSHYRDLERDFLAFWPELTAFVAREEDVVPELWRSATAL